MRHKWYRVACAAGRCEGECTAALIAEMGKKCLRDTHGAEEIDLEHFHDVRVSVRLLVLSSGPRRVPSTDRKSELNLEKGKDS